MSFVSFSPLPCALGIAVYWIALGILGLTQRADRDAGRILYAAGAVGGCLLAVTAAWALGDAPTAVQLPLGLPGLPFHLRLDSLSAFFLALLGLAVTGISLFSTGYFTSGSTNNDGVTCLHYHFFLAAMVFVFLADDAYMFMVAWESMALVSYFLVASDHRYAEIRSAGFLYLVVAHVGAMAILLCFGVLHGEDGGYSFEAMRTADRTPFWATTAFLLALVGFGAKAGFLPLHAWLPEAHPAAPSPVSALMSGVMLKTAIYGLLRIAFDLLPVQYASWGVIALATGLLTMLYGVLFAAVQTDMKRLLAYSSIENIGLVLAAIGLAIVFRVHGMPTLAALALGAALFHCLNHALFKSLLFLATGAVMHATSQRSLGRLGGLIHPMPWVAGAALVGTLSIAGLPPLNGFVSEWLLLQAFLLSPDLPDPYLRMLVPVATAALVLAAAVAAYVMVKFYGIVFLGQPREPSLRYAHDADGWQRAGLLFLVVCCVLAGLFPVTVLNGIDHVANGLLGRGMGDAVARQWLHVTPVSAERASYSPLLVLAGILGVVSATFLYVRFRYHLRLRRAPAWDCGFPAQTARMQDTAEGFGQPIKQIFEPFFRIEREMPSPFDGAPRYRARTEDKLWYVLYLPLVGLVQRVAGWVARLQHGRIQWYLVYSFATLLALLVLIRFP
jgi:hydrogenase-4 component B